MIINAADQPLTGNPGTLPDMSGTVAGWFQPMTFTRITKTVVDHILVETQSSVDALGVRQPMKPQMLLIKPEGQRGWKWETFHCQPDTILEIDDIAIFNGVKYRVMERLDYREYGYLEYHLVQGYEESA